MIRLFLIFLLFFPHMALAGDTPELMQPIISDPLSVREWILVIFLTMIIVCGLAAFFGNRYLKSAPFSARTLMGFVMISVFIASVALVFLLATAFGASALFGLLFLIAMLGLFKLMNQFEINR